MSVALQPELLKLTRPMLEERFIRALEEVEANQRAPGEPRGWQVCNQLSILTLDDGTLFLSDGEEAKVGQAGMIIGGVLLAFGLALVGIFLEGKQDEPWMQYAGPALLSVGGYLVWTGRNKRRVARAQPRVTGAYLFDDVLLHVGLMGCRTFPVERVRSFESRANSEGTRSRLFIHYEDDDGVARETVLFHDDATETLGQWLARRRLALADRQPAR